MSDTVVITEEPTQVIIDDGTGTLETVVVEDQAVTVVSVGEQGPQGPQGPSGDKNYEQAFINATNVTVNHNLAKYPSVTVIDSAGDECEGFVDHLSINQLTISFSASFSGMVTCN